jgi:hypothetical protein
MQPLKVGLCTHGYRLAARGHVWLLAFVSSSALSSLVRALATG